MESRPPGADVPGGVCADRRPEALPPISTADRVMSLEITTIVLASSSRRTSMRRNGTGSLESPLLEITTSSSEITVKPSPPLFLDRQAQVALGPRDEDGGPLAFACRGDGGPIKAWFQQGAGPAGDASGFAAACAWRPDRAMTRARVDQGPRMPIDADRTSVTMPRSRGEPRHRSAAKWRKAVTLPVGRVAPKTGSLA